MHRWCQNRRRAERQAAEKRQKEELAAEEEKARAAAKAAALFAQNGRQQDDRANVETDGNYSADGAEEDDEENENQEDAVVPARKAPPRRSTAARAGAPVLQQSPAPPALRPKIFGTGNETALPTPQAPAPAPERNTAVERTVADKKAAAAPTSGPTKCLSLPTHNPLFGTFVSLPDLFSHSIAGTRSWSSMALW